MGSAQAPNGQTMQKGEGRGELVRYVHGCESFMALMNTDIVNVAIHVRVHIVWYRRYVHKAEENIHMS